MFIRRRECCRSIQAIDNYMNLALETTMSRSIQHQSCQRITIDIRASSSNNCSISITTSIFIIRNHSTVRHGDMAMGMHAEDIDILTLKKKLGSDLKLIGSILASKSLISTLNTVNARPRTTKAMEIRNGQITWKEHFSEVG